MAIPTADPERTSTLSLRARPVITGLALVYWASLLVDLFTHPGAAGPNEGGSLFRWLSALIGTGTIFTALYITRRVPRNPVGLLLLLWGAGATGWSLRSEWISTGLGTLASSIFGLIFFSISCPAVILMLCNFPDGRPYPRRLQNLMPLLFGLLSFSGLFYLAGYSPSFTGGYMNPFYIPALEWAGITIYLIAFVFGMTLGLITLVMRYRAGDERLRLQLRWLMWLLATGILIASVPLDSLLGPQFEPSINIASFLFWQAFPALGIGVAMLRHNLWEIDVIIRRTLVWTIVSSLLAMVYFGSVALLQALFFKASGQDSNLMVVISTLSIAALIHPLRRGVQDFVDRRFYRKKYNAEKALECFRNTARDLVDARAILTRLLGVVEETVQPESISVWVQTVKHKER